MLDSCRRILVVCPILLPFLFGRRTTLYFVLLVAPMVGHAVYLGLIQLQHLLLSQQKYFLISSLHKSSGYSALYLDWDFTEVLDFPHF